jgi:flagellum-specific peptidoglycan hydrolase FlgJ
MKKRRHYTGKANFQKALLPGAFFKLLPVLFFTVLCQVGLSQMKYVKKYQPLADSLSGEYGIPAAVILGVAILESGAGTSRNCKLLNNHFGIVGKNDLLKTKGVKSRYKQYPNILASYVDFCRIISRKKFYKKLKNNTDYTLWVEAMCKAGYSEVPVEWKTKVLATIRKNKLSAS